MKQSKCQVTDEWKNDISIQMDYSAMKSYEVLINAKNGWTLKTCSLKEDTGHRLWFQLHKTKILMQSIMATDQWLPRDEAENRSRRGRVRDS